MYNYFTEDKKKKRTLQQANKLARQLAYIQKKKQNDQVLVRNFIRRTNMTLHKQLQRNQRVERYRDPKYQPRKTHKDFQVGPPAFYFKDRSSVHRVNDAIQRHKQLDNVPFFAKSSPSTHHFRDNTTSKSIRFTPFNTTSRVMQTIKSMKSNQVQSSWDLNIRQYNKKIQKSLNKQQNNKQSRSILPTLNIKTHPKTLESLKNKYQLGTLKSRTVNLKSQTIRIDPKIDKENIPVKTNRIKVKFAESTHVELLQ